MVGNTLHINPDMSVSIGDGGMNIRLPRNTGVNPKYNPNVRLVQIGKGFDNTTLSDTSVDKIKNEIKKYVDVDNLPDLKFIIECEREEARADSDRLKLFNKIFNAHPYIIVTNNIEAHNGEDIFFLNNNPWIFDFNEDDSFQIFLRELRERDLGTIKKKFMFLINHYSDIRFDILKFIYKKGKQNDGNISLNLIDFDNLKNIEEDRFMNDLKEFSIPYPISYDSYPTITQISDNERVKKTLLGINHVATLPTFNYRIYLESFYEIITETENHLRMNECHISEKLLKPLKSALPFVYYGKERVKDVLENLGFRFTSPIYYFGMGDGFFEHLDMLMNMDHNWFNYQQRKYLDEYFHNMGVWNKFITRNNRQIIKFAYI